MIVTITMNPAVDKSTETEKLVPDKKLRCSTLITEAGGGGINVSKGIKKLGGDSLSIFTSGGMNGKILENYLSAQQIAYRTIPIDSETRENMVVLETSTQAQYRFVLPGASLSQKEIDDCVKLLYQITPAPTIIVASGSLPPGFPENFYAQLVPVAKKIGAKYIVDTSGPALSLAAHEGVYLLKPNLSELSKLVNREELQLNEVDDAAMEVIDRGDCEVIVVSLGPSGALLVTKKAYEHIPAPTVKKQGTVGAGDSMVSGMVYKMLQGKSLREMVRFGVACGTATTMESGSKLFEIANVNKLYDWINKYAEKYKLNLDN